MLNYKQIWHGIKPIRWLNKFNLTNSVRPRSFSPGGGLGGSGFWPFFPASFSGLLTFPFILTCVPYPSSTCMIDFSKTDICPISPYPEWLGVVVKAGEYGSVRCRVLNGSKGSFPWSLYFPAYPSLLTQLF